MCHPNKKLLNDKESLIYKLKHKFPWVIPQTTHGSINFPPSTTPTRTTLVRQLLENFNHKVKTC